MDLHRIGKGIPALQRGLRLHHLMAGQLSRKAVAKTVIIRLGRLGRGTALIDLHRRF